MSNVQTLNTDRAWDQLPDETDTAYDRFGIYLQLGPDRSISKVADKLQKGSGYAKHLRRWSSKYNWVERANTYDKYLLRKSLENKEEVIDEMTAMVLDKAKELISEMIDMGLMDGLQVVSDNVENDDGAIIQQTINVYAQKLKAIESALDRIGFVKQKEKPEEEEGATTVNNYIQNIYAKMELRDKELGRD